MEKTKYIYSGGFAFNEQEDMDKLRAYAKEGWLLERQQFMGYQLKKGEPKNIKFSLDYQKEADDDYFAYFEAAGWTLVCSTANEIHIFSAPEGTTPIHTDKIPLIEKYKTEKKRMGKIALPSLFVTLMLFFLTVLGGIGWVPETIGNISTMLWYVSLIVPVFTVISFFGYSSKVRKLRKN
jgi:hypothetical protein